MLLFSYVIGMYSSIFCKMSNAMELGLLYSQDLYFAVKHHHANLVHIVPVI